MQSIWPFILVLKLFPLGESKKNQIDLVSAFRNLFNPPSPLHVSDVSGAPSP